MMHALPLLAATMLDLAASGPKAHIAVFGATGGVGAEATYQALERGARVSALVRSPSKLVVPPGSGGAAAGSRLASDRLRVIQGDVTSPQDVADFFEGADEPITGCVIALGGKTSEVGKTMLTDGTTNVISEMRSRGIQRVSAVTSIGAGDSFDQAPFAFKVFMWTVLKDAFVDKNAQEALFLSGPGKDLEWTVVRPGGLTLGPPSDTTKVISGPAGSISRADVAAFCLDAVMDDAWAYLRKTPCISAGAA